MATWTSGTNNTPASSQRTTSPLTTNGMAAQVTASAPWTSGSRTNGLRPRMAFASSGGWSQSVAHADSQPRTQPRMAAGITAGIEFIRAPRRTYTPQSNEPRDQAMDVWVLGVAAIVLIALTLWIVSQAPSTDAAVATPARDLPPVGDEFEDQYTSATADLSAGGVAEAFNEPRPAAPV